MTDLGTLGGDFSIASGISDSGDIVGRVELDATDLSAAKLRDIESSMHLPAPGKGGRAYIVNEAHGMNRSAIRQLLVLLGRLPSHVVVIFTTTDDGQDSLFEGHEDAQPLLSRCVRLDLARRDLSGPFAERVKATAH